MRFGILMIAILFSCGLPAVASADLSVSDLQALKKELGLDQQSSCKQYSQEYESAAKKFFKACGRLAHGACIDAYNECENNTDAVTPKKDDQSSDATDGSSDDSSDSSDSASSTDYYSAQDFGGYSQGEIDKIKSCPASGPGLDKLRKELTKNQKEIDKVKEQIQEKNQKVNEIKNKMQQLQADFQKDIANENSDYKKKMTQDLPQEQQKQAQKLDAQLTQVENDEKGQNIKISEIKAEEIDALNKAADTCYQYALAQVKKRIDDRTNQISKGTLKVQTQNDLWNQAGNTLQQRAGNYAYAEYSACLQSLTYEAQVESIKNKSNIEVTAANAQINSDQSQALKIEQQEVSLSQQNQTETQQLADTHNQNLRDIASEYQSKMQDEDTKLNSLMGNDSANMKSVQQQVQQALKSMLSDHKNINNGLNDPVGQISMDGKAGASSEIGQLQLELNALEAANTSILEAKKAESKAVSDPKNFLGDGGDLIGKAGDFASVCRDDSHYGKAAQGAADLCHKLGGDPANCNFDGPSAIQSNDSAQATATQSSHRRSTQGNGVNQ